MYTMCIGLLLSTLALVAHPLWYIPYWIIFSSSVNLTRLSSCLQLWVCVRFFLILELLGAISLGWFQLICHLTCFWSLCCVGCTTWSHVYFFLLNELWVVIVHFLCAEYYLLLLDYILRHSFFILSSCILLSRTIIIEHTCTLKMYICLSWLQEWDADSDDILQWGGSKEKDLLGIHYNLHRIWCSDFRGVIVQS